MKSIIAIVVTYNRKELLIRCLASLKNQTQPPEKILVVDNASTDGTEELLRKSGWFSDPAFEFLSLKENLGGAGGFSSGWQHALKSEFRWLWMMDDDGYPADDCLECLLNVAERKDLDAISPMQVDIDNFSLPAFPCADARGISIRKLPHLGANGDFFTPNQANLFNGLLIRSETIKRVGLPRSELFIRGDEVEYTRRMQCANIRFGTWISTYFYHPSDRKERHSILGGLAHARDANNDFKNYYLYRNKGVAFRENGWLWLLPIDILRYVYYFLIHKKGDLRGLRLWAAAMLDGLRGKLGRNPDY